MSIQSHICESVQGVIEYYSQHPNQTFSADMEAVAVIEEGLRARAKGPIVQTLLCDMPEALGGGASAPSPGWMMRAALANCEAVIIALRAAQFGIELSSLKVRVDSISDDRGILGMEESMPAGPLNMKIDVRIGAKGVSKVNLREVVEWAEKHSPVGEPLTRVMPVETVVNIAL